MTEIKKIAFGHQGLFGDVTMSQPSTKVLKDLYPDASIYLTINKKYRDIAPLFYNQPTIDGFFITDGYDDFPTDVDRRNAGAMKFDLFFDPMAPHLDGDDWFKRRHQVKDVAFSYGLPECDDKINLNKYWPDENKLDKTIAICPFGGYGAAHKSLTSDQIYEIIDFATNNGYKLLHLCPPNADYKRTYSKLNDSNTNFLDSVKLLHRCDFLITVDTAMCWIASAYNIPTLALYSDGYYTKEFVKNIQPINPNAIYLSEDSIGNIALDKITESLKLL